MLKLIKLPVKIYSRNSKANYWCISHINGTPTNKLIQNIKSIENIIKKYDGNEVYNYGQPLLISNVKNDMIKITENIKNLKSISKHIKDY